MESDLYREAERRISDTPELTPYRSILLEYRMNHKHLNWVATGDVAEIVRWASGIEANIATA
jgi:hypothetical protein